ncbi:MAG: OmpH family outer membrane protein [Elusimicrobiota bacterium]|jgi:Skp family chaperone for outer membrane proteins
MMKKTIVPCLSVLLLLAALPSRALEISLEENRGERGSIGYVDLHRVFQLFPQTQKARQSFQEILHQAEEQVNLRKTDLLALRAELSRLTSELDLLQKTPIPAALPVEAPKTPPAAAVQPPAETPKTTQAAEQAPVEAPAQTPPPAADRKQAPLTEELALPGMSKPLTINLPGLTTAPLTVEPSVRQEALPPEKPSEAGSPSAATAAAPEISTTTVIPPLPQPTPSDIAAAAARSHEDRLNVLRSQIEAKRKELADKELNSQKHQEKVEKDLLELEGRRTEVLLGKIYVVIQDVARENGVSVVVDKSQILFGQKTVDLTEKVLKKLESL